MIRDQKVNAITLDIIEVQITKIGKEKWTGELKRWGLKLNCLLLKGKVLYLNTLKLLKE